MNAQLVVPAVPHRVVPRPRLTELLDGTSDYPITIVAAEAGAGKSVLLGDWCRQHSGPAAWLTVTSSDNAPARFWPLVFQATRRGDVVGGALTSEREGGIAELLQSVYGPDDLPETTVLVIDDAHVLTHPQILEGLDHVIRFWSHRLRLVLAARSDPLLPLHRYRLAGIMREIRSRDLAMTSAEAASLFDAHDVALDDTDLDVLLRRTEGWTAGLRLAALRMEGMPRPSEFVAQFATDRGSAGEYLLEEVLGREPEPVRRMLVETSFLDTVTGPLADAVTKLPECGQTLAALARKNSFVLPVDSAGTAYRYHQLFRDVLFYLDQRDTPDDIAARRQRAATWFHDHGRLLDALHWSIEAADTELTASLLGHGGLAQAFVHRNDVPNAVLEATRLSGAFVGPGEENLAARWAVAALVATPATAPADLARLRAERSDDAATDSDLRITLSLAEVLLARCAGRYDDLDAAAEWLLTAEDIAKHTAQVSGLRPSLLLAQARSRFATGRLVEVEPRLRSALDEPDVHHVPSLELEILAVLAVAESSAARARHADDAIARATTLLADHPDLIAPVSLDVAMARYAYLQGNFAAMAQVVRRAAASEALYGDPALAASVTYVHATYLAGVGQLAEAGDLLRGSPALTTQTGMLAVYRDAELAAIETALGRPNAALALLEPYARSPFRVAVGVAAARAHLALRQLDAARALIRDMLTTPSPLIDRPLMVEAVLCDAQIAWADGDDIRAVELIDRAVQVSSGDILLPFQRLTVAFAALLRRHPDVAARWPAPSPAADPTAITVSSSRSRLVNPLTERERTVLRYLATNMSTDEIADDLCLSTNTVKTHMAAIYRKLSVRGRRDAVHRARTLELL